MPPAPHPKTHPAGHAKHRVPGPSNGLPDPSKDGAGPAGHASHSTPPVSPLLTAPPVTITADILGEIVDVAKVDVGTVVQNINTTVQKAKITTALAEAMLIAQLVVESAGFTKAEVVEGGAESLEVYNDDATVPAVFKQPSPVFGTVKKTKTGVLARYLHGKVQVKKWEHSRDAYLKAKAAYAVAQPGKNFDASGLWKPVVLTDFVVGDVEVPRWKLLYDPESPRPSRAQKAKDNGNVNPGDGLKYIGRGYIQLTWQVNYAAAGKLIGVDLVNDPKQAADPTIAVKVAAWFWDHNHCNGKANADTDKAFENVTRAINGGVMGLADRKIAYKDTKNAFLKRINVAPAAPVPLIPFRLP